MRWTRLYQKLGGWVWMPLHSFNIAFDFPTAHRSWSSDVNDAYLAWKSAAEQDVAFWWMPLNCLHLLVVEYRRKSSCLFVSLVLLVLPITQLFVCIGPTQQLLRFSLLRLPLTHGELVTLFWWCCKVCKHSWLSKFQTLTLLSADPLASRDGTVEFQDNERTASWWLWERMGGVCCF